MTARTGIRFTGRNGQAAGHFSILESLGVGVALFDCDKDGDLDVLIPGGGGFSDGPSVIGRDSALFRNEGNWRFTDVTAAAGLKTSQLYSHGAFVADYDNDGFPDVLITGYGAMLLFRNRGDGTFEETAAAAGLTDSRWNTGAAWGDFNGDGILDVYVAHYVNWSFQNHPRCKGFGGVRDVCSPANFDPLDDSLYLGRGDGTFRDESKTAGLVSGGEGLAALTGDFDLDGNLDVYVANDTSPNFLYRNDGHGHFSEAGIDSGSALGSTASADGSMGVELGDFNRDGRPDIWVTNYEHQNFAMYRNEGAGVFQHVSDRMGIAAVGTVYVGFGTTVADFDHDGDEDIFVTNGHVMSHSRNSPLQQKPLLFENIDGRRFVNVADQAGPYLKRSHLGRGVAAGDLDDDGDPDLIVSHTNQPITILANESRKKTAGLRIRLVGTNCSRDAIGASARLMVNGARQVRFVKSGAGYFSTSETALSFSPPTDSRPIRIAVTWPNGEKQILAIPPGGEFLVVQGDSVCRRLDGK